jgi:asparagine synthetase B (glutamine-hydrolysing)
LVYADGKKNLTCAVNGEIYNWKDLIKGLKNRDVPLVTGSDCEVIMHLVSRPFESRSTLTEAGRATTDHS